MSAPPLDARPLRADVRRNYEALVAAGQKVFSRDGADAPMDDVAKEAGAGRGTRYRHFPSGPTSRRTRSSP
ncbi:helix-turn-helix domain-containing protein [Streptomyces sp. NPDC051105]|uniref:helix-turn-helix domain-containing protein n=1 Tax=Streptomyces sp. NPDC051105 TaxID=3154843 RepID=UPI003447589D